MEHKQVLKGFVFSPGFISFYRSLEHSSEFVKSLESLREERYKDRGDR